MQSPKLLRRHTKNQSEVILQNMVETRVYSQSRTCMNCVHAGWRRTSGCGHLRLSGGDEGGRKEGRTPRGDGVPASAQHSRPPAAVTDGAPVTLLEGRTTRIQGGRYWCRHGRQAGGARQSGGAKTHRLEREGKYSDEVGR